MRAECVLYGTDEGTDACSLNADGGRVAKTGFWLERYIFRGGSLVMPQKVGFRHGRASVNNECGVL